MMNDLRLRNGIPREGGGPPCPPPGGLAYPCIGLRSLNIPPPRPPDKKAYNK